MARRDPLRTAAAGATLVCALSGACSAPPPPEPAGAPPAAPVPTQAYPVPTQAYDVDGEGRFPPPPVVMPRAARGWRDTLAIENTAPTPHDAAGDTMTQASQGEQPQAASLQPGFRVQVAACATLESARALQREIRAHAAWPVYVEHEPPYYKVRVGDCSTEDACRALESRLRADGWQSAWLVRTQIVSP